MQKQSPKITIITPVYNGEEYLEETINSVLTAAKDISFEYLVINDGSTDGTSKILESFGDKIRVIEKANSGESSTVTLGFGESKAKLVMVLSADDPLFTSEIFKNVFEKFDFEPNLVAIYPNWKMIGPKGELLKIVQVPDFSMDLLLGRCQTLPGPGVIIRKSAAISIGGRRSKWTFVGDYDFWLRLSTVGEIRHRNEVLAQWRMHSSSTSINSRGIRMATERLEVVKEFLKEFEVSPNLQRKALGTSHYMAARLIFFDPKIHGKRILMLGFWKRKGWIKGAKISVILYIILHPLSRWLYNKIKKYLPEQLPLQ